MTGLEHIHLTEFARRHFDRSKPGTTILDRSPEQFERELNEAQQVIVSNGLLETQGRDIPGYAPFCRLLFVKNWTDARVGALEITPGTIPFLQSGYQARSEDELPVLSRWFEGLTPPIATILCLILYDETQIRKEDEHWSGGWGIVSILGQSHADEEPMTPITMMRNALGIKEGGSGVPLDREAYARSVEFWDKHAVVKV